MMNAAYIVTVLVVTCILFELPSCNADCPSSRHGKRNRTRCTDHSECADDRACLGHKCEPCKCRLKEQCFLAKANRAECDCSNDNLHTGDYCECTIPTCSQPPPQEHVLIEDESMSFPIGHQLAYKCTPCSYVDPSNTWTMECQPDLSWTTPTCVYGPDVGLLPNGQPIPSGAVGCLSAAGAVCLPWSYEGHVGYGLQLNGVNGECYCDDVCCGSDDCCYDANC